MSIILNRVEAVATGIGDASVKTNDGALNDKLRIPEGKNNGETNATPETLFAAAYASCFLSAVQAAAKEQTQLDAHTEVNAEVHLRRNAADEPYELEVTIVANLGSSDDGSAKDLVEKARAFFPFPHKGAESVKIFSNESHR